MYSVCLLREPCYVSFTGSHAYITSQISNVTYRSAGIYQIKDPVREKGKRMRRCVSFNGSQALQAGLLTALGDVPRKGVWLI